MSIPDFFRSIVPLENFGPSFLFRQYRCVKKALTHLHCLFWHIYLCSRPVHRALYTRIDMRVTTTQTKRLRNDRNKASRYSHVVELW